MWIRYSYRSKIGEVILLFSLSGVIGIVILSIWIGLNTRKINKGKQASDSKVKLNNNKNFV